MIEISLSPLDRENMASLHLQNDEEIKPGLFIRLRDESYKCQLDRCFRRNL